MKPGVRALGIAESSTGERATLAGAVVRADRVVDGLELTSCTVGGTDATETVIGLTETLDRPDVRALLIAGIAPAWFNILDLHAISDATARPTISVSFEPSEGLETAIEREFEGTARRERLARYRAQPSRRPLTVGTNDDTLFVRNVGIEDEAADTLVKAFTSAGGRPEPVRVARLAARAGERYRESSADTL